jgi:hypothetical protein
MRRGASVVIDDWVSETSNRVEGSLMNAVGALYVAGQGYRFSNGAPAHLMTIRLQCLEEVFRDVFGIVLQRLVFPRKAI